MKELLEPLVPIAASFIVFALGLGARVAAASALPVSDRLIDRRLIPGFANVSSIASPSPSSLTERTVSSDKLVAKKSPENLSSNSAEAENPRQHNEEVQLNQHTGDDEAISSSPLTGKKDGEAISSSPITRKKDDDCSKMHVDENIHQRGRSSSGNQIEEISEKLEFPENEELTKAYEKWKAKPYALTVPLRIAALRGSVPPAWIKDFMQAQGKRMKFRVEFQGSLRGIISELASALLKERLSPQSIMAADLVTIGDSWLDMAICGEMIEPIKNPEQQEWFNHLNDRWKVHLRRDHNGQIDPRGEVWGVPYRWGSMVVAYRKDKFAKHKIPAIEDWEDLWRPELRGKISMVDSPREVVGAVLKYMGASYNAKNFEYDVPGGRNAVKEHFLMLQRQVRLFDSVHYLKAFGSGDVWVAVGWTSDVIPAAKRMSNVAVVVPKSGTSLWADLWSIPATSSIPSDKVGGRVRGPSPLIHQWFDFCLQPARATPFEQDVFPGASPLFLPDNTLDNTNKNDFIQRKSTNAIETTPVKKGGPQLDTNLVAGMPPANILQKSEFLEPLSDETLVDYKWLLTENIEEGQGWPSTLWQFLKGIRETFKIAPIRGIR
jgi:spermidine/putrescine-binding protein